MTEYTISIISDTVCPWCYIGLRRLQAAIARHQAKSLADSFTLKWHPFQPRPHLPEARATKRSTNYTGKSSEEDADLVSTRLRTAGQDSGIKFSLTGMSASNTLDSHRLLEYAGHNEGSNGKATGSGNDQDATVSLKNRATQTRLVEELFADYFERKMYIADHSVLIRAAGRVGLDETEVKRFLGSDALVEQVHKQANAARADGVHGVPHFTINDVFTIEGAQEPAAFLMLFERWKKKRSKI